MAWVDDFSFDIDTGNVRHVSGTTRYPVLDIHRGLQALVYQATKSGDDQLDITDLVVPSRRNSDTDIELLSYNIGAGSRDVNFDAAGIEFMFGGSITQESGDVRYSGLAIAGDFSVDASVLPQIAQNNIKLTNYWGQSFTPNAALGYAVRILVLSRTGGADIDGGRVLVKSRGFGFDYREGATVLGRNEAVAAVGTIASDSFNQTAIATIAGFTDIVNTEGFQAIDLNNNNGPFDYVSQWSRGSRNKPDVYERIKWEGRDGTGETHYGLDAFLYRGITHSVAYDAEAGGSFIEASATPLTFGNGATAQLIGLGDNGTDGILYVQLLTGLVPADNDTITQGGVTALVNGAPTVRALGTNSIAGNFTGAWIGSYGTGFAPADLNNSDSITPLVGLSQAPPNNQLVVATGIIANETRLILGKDDGSGNLDKDLYSAAAGNNSGNGTLVVNETITNEPTTGFVRIFNGVGEDEYEYSSFTASTFTLVGTLSQNYTSAVNVYATVFDEIPTATSIGRAWVYTVDTPLVGQAIDSGVTPNRQFPIAGTFSSAGFSVNLVNTPDT